MKRLTLLGVFAFFICFASHSQVFSFEFGGLERFYKVHLPPDYDADSIYPMVFNLHGAGSNGIEQQLYTGFDFVADTAGIIMVYPDGVDNLWNVYGSTGPDDVGFISALIDTMAAHYSIDLNRVYSTGMSMGGFMSYRLACELESRIAAIASVTGLLVTSPCEPERPVPILQMHGTADPVVPYAGVPITISYWTLYNNCPDEPVITELPDIDPDDGCTVTVSYYGFCNDSTEVILYTINGGEHTWPGAVIHIGVTNHDINGSVEIWNFFRNYTLEGYVDIMDIENDPYSISVYPNPVSQFATLEVNGPISYDLTARIYDIHGRLISRTPLDGQQRSLLDVHDWAPGIYFLELTGKKGRGTTRFIVK